jgi:hypothetical protein
LAPTAVARLVVFLACRLKFNLTLISKVISVKIYENWS